MSTRYDAMAVREYTDNQGNTRSQWTKIGAAFVNKDGSIGIQLDAFPMNGKIILQVPLSKEEIEKKRADREHQQDNRPRPQKRGGPPQRMATPQYPKSWDEATGEGGQAPAGGFADEQDQ